LVKLVRPVSALSPVAFDPSWFKVVVTWLTPEPATVVTLLIEPDVVAEPAEMLAAQQRETRPTVAVAAATR